MISLKDSMTGIVTDVGEIVLMIDIEAELGISSFRNDDTRAGMYFAAISLAIINF